MLLTVRDDNPNGATVRFLLDRAPMPDDAGQYERLVLMFDGNDNDASDTDSFVADSKLVILLRKCLGATLVALSYLPASFCYRNFNIFERRQRRFARIGREWIGVGWFVFVQITVNLGIGFLLPFGMGQFTLARWLWF